jgi:hypothetical protein
MGQSAHNQSPQAVPSSQSTPEPEHQPSVRENSPGSSGQHTAGTSSPIYVSMHGPVGEPAFRPSKTKPIPKWMEYLPGKGLDEWDCVERPRSVLDNYFSPSGSSIAGSDTESGTRASPSPRAVPAHMDSGRSTVSHSNEEQHADPQEPRVSEVSTNPPRPSSAFVSEPARVGPAFKAVQMSRPFTFIDEKPGQRPSSRFQPGGPSLSRHVRFISPPKTTSSPSLPSGSVDHAKSPSASSEYLDRRVPQASKGRSSVLLPSSLLGGGLSVATTAVKGYSGGNAGPPARTILRSFADPSSSGDLAHVSTEAEGVVLGNIHPQHHGNVTQRRFHGGGDGAAESVGGRGTGRVATFQDQLKRVFGFV